MSSDVAYYCRVRYLDINDFALSCKNTAIPIIPPFYNVEVYNDGTTNMYGYYAKGKKRFLYCIHEGRFERTCRITEYSSSPIAESKTRIELRNILEQYKELKSRIYRLKKIKE